MKKTTIIASLVVLACAAVVGTFALAGAGKLANVRANAEPKEYSVTFDESNTTVEAVGDHFAICATTPRGAKVGVVGYNNYDHDDYDGTSFTFNGASFWHLCLFDNGGALEKVGAYQFSTITGFAISFSGDFGEDMVFIANGGGTMIEDIASGAPHTGLSFAPEDAPMFYTGDRVKVSSLKIWYTCQVS